MTEDDLQDALDDLDGSDLEVLDALAEGSGVDTMEISDERVVAIVEDYAP